MINIINNIVTENTKVLVICVVFVLILEVVSGVYKAVINKQLNSTKFRTGLYGKIGYLIYIALSFLIAFLLNLPLILQATLSFVIASEGVSILENLCEAKIPVPGFLKEILQKIKENSEKGADKQ